MTMKERERKRKGRKEEEERNREEEGRGRGERVKGREGVKVSRGAERAASFGVRVIDEAAAGRKRAAVTQTDDTEEITTRSLR